MPKKPKKTSKELQYMGRCIKARRKDCGLTQGELAEQVSRGLQHIQNIEGGLINPSYEVLTGIIQRLAMSIDCIIYPELPELEKEKNSSSANSQPVPRKIGNFFWIALILWLSRSSAGIMKSYLAKNSSRTIKQIASSVCTPNVSISFPV